MALCHGRCFAFAGKRMSIVFCNQPPSRQPATTATPSRHCCLESAFVGSAVLLSTVTGCGTAAREAKTGDKPPSPAVRSRLHYAACLAERAELMLSRLSPPARHNCSREVQAVLQFTFYSNHCLKRLRGRSPLEVGTFSFHLGSRCALYGPATGFACEGGLQNCCRPSPDAALQLARRKRGTSLPRPQSASGSITQLALPSGLN